MDRRTFGILCELLHTDGKLKKYGLVTIEEQACSFLHVLAHHVKNRTISHRFNRSRETVSRYFNFVLNGITWLQRSLLQKPDPIPYDCIDARWKWYKVLNSTKYIFICLNILVLSQGVFICLGMFGGIR